MQTQRVINVAKKRLKENPFDPVHDYKHHEFVYANCVGIIKTEVLKVDKDLLFISAWFHDIEDRTGKTDFMEETMRKYGFAEEQIEKCKTIVKEHTYGKGQTLLESKVLYDSDKLEYFSYQRISNAKELTKAGKMSPELLKKYKKTWEDRHMDVLYSFNFKSNKNRALDKLLTIKELVEGL